MPCYLLQAKLYPRVLAAMKPGATLGLSHGFLLGVMQNDGVDFREDINVILNAPKVGSSLRNADQIHSNDISYVTWVLSGMLDCLRCCEATQCFI